MVNDKKKGEDNSLNHVSRAVDCDELELVECHRISRLVNSVNRIRLRHPLVPTEEQKVNYVRRAILQ